MSQDNKRPRIEMAPSEKVEAFDDWARKVLAALGFPKAMVTDWSSVSDFIPHCPDLEEVSRALGIPVVKQDYIYELAERLAAKDAANKKCPRCGSDMRLGDALENGVRYGIPDFTCRESQKEEDLRGQTFSFSGEARLIKCLKCSACGHSMRINQTR